MNLYVPVYNPASEIRLNELKKAISVNCSFNFIEKIFLFQEKNNFLNICNQKIINVFFENRVTFQNIFDYSNLFDKKINILCNADISLTDTFEKIIINEKDFFCLTRYENGKLFKMAHCSQDTWCWYNKCKIQNANFNFGVLGCDNTVAYMAKQFGYLVSNPSLKYKTNHHHDSNIRNYDESTRLPRNNYLVGLRPS